MTQNDRILNALKHGPLTPLEALRDYGVFRLAARVYDLRQAGVEVEDEWVEAKNKHGEPCRIKRYRLA